MLKKWEKIEALLNFLIQKFKLLFLKFFFKIVPAKLITWVRTTYLKTIEFLKNCFLKTISWLRKQKELKDVHKQAVSEFIKKTKAEISDVKSKVVSLTKTKPRIPNKEDFKYLKNALQELPKYFWKIMKPWMRNTHSSTRSAEQHKDAEYKMTPTKRAGRTQGIETMNACVEQP